MGSPILTLKAHVNRDRTLQIRPFLSVKILNWDEVSYLVERRGYFNVIPTYKKNTIVSVYILKFLKCE